jgi:HAD superfamily phosphatase
MTIVIFDIDGVIRDVGGSYRRALADTVEHFTQGSYRPTVEEIDRLKEEGLWNNDWEASQELITRYFQAQSPETSRDNLKDQITYPEIVKFFQSRYRGTDPINWNGYICSEPLLVEPKYLEALTRSGIRWGFFSGATRGSAEFVLTKRLGLVAPVLVAMEDAPGKPDPTGLFQALEQLEQLDQPEQRTFLTPEPVIYLGDTVADMYTVNQARHQEPKRTWIGVGVLPPHAQATPERVQAYSQTLEAAGAVVVIDNVQKLTLATIQELLKSQ